AQDLDVAAAGCRGRAIGSPAQAGIECSGEVGPVPRDPAGQARVGSRDQRGVGRGQGVEDVWQLEAVAGVLDARIGGGGGAGGRALAAGDGGLGGKGGVKPLGRGGRGDGGGGGEKSPTQNGDGGPGGPHPRPGGGGG